MTAIKAGDTVKIHYTGTLTNGETFDSSRGRDPLEFEVGSGQIIRGLDAALPGLKVGDTRVVDIVCDDAYGPVNPAAKQDVPRATIPDHIPVDPGTQLQMQTPDGQTVAVRVVASNDETVTLDANHPLAGEDLTFDIEVVAINA